MNHLETLIKRYPALEVCRNDILAGFSLLKDCFESKKMLYLAGNGGSCADCEHIVGELMKGFRKKRTISKEFESALLEADESRGKLLRDHLQQGLPAMALAGAQALNTAFSNDVENGGLYTFAQKLCGYGKSGDVFWGITTSGNSENILLAATVARAKGMKILGLTGESGGSLREISDVTICVPEHETYRVQELHLPVYHCLCLMLEDEFFNE